jgi:hypothetical protein
MSSKTYPTIACESSSRLAQSAGIFKYSKDNCRSKNPRLNDDQVDYGHPNPVR